MNYVIHLEKYNHSKIVMNLLIWFSRTRFIRKSNIFKIYYSKVIVALRIMVILLDLYLIISGIILKIKMNIQNIINNNKNINNVIYTNTVKVDNNKYKNNLKEEEKEKRKKIRRWRILYRRINR